MTDARIEPGGPGDIGLLNWSMIAVGAKVARAPGGLPKLFTTMARHHSLFRAWLFFAGRMMPRGKLPRRETELVILRTASLCNCEYELVHHRRIGRTAGLSAAEIERATSPQLDGWSPRERAILAVANELHAKENLDDETWQELLRHLSEREAIELLLLAGHYRMLATFILTLRIAPDADH